MGPDISLGFGQKVSAGGPAAAGGPKAILQYSQAGGTCPYICTAVLLYCITAVQQYSNTAVQQYSNTAIQQYSSTAVQQYSITDIRGPKSYSSTAILHYSSTAIQQYSSTAVQQYRPREKIEDRSTAAVIGYARVSPREQAARGLSLEVQKAQVLAMAMLEDGGPEDVQIREDKQPRRGRGLQSILPAVRGRQGVTPILGNATPACMAAWLEGGYCPWF